MEADKKIVSIKPDQEAPAVKKAPYNVEAEQFIIGSILNNNESINKVADFLTSEHFYEPIHQKIYEAIQSLYDKGIIANPVTLKNHFQGDEAIEEAGGSNYLLKLSGLASGIINLRDYGLIVYNLHISRALIEIGQELVEDSFRSSGNENATLQIEKPESKLFNLASTGYSDTNFAPARVAFNTAIRSADIASKSKGLINGVKTDLTHIDALLGGFNNSDLIILAARPSMGKTALALNFALNGAKFLKTKHDQELQEFKSGNSDFEEEPRMGSVGVISLEMSSEQLATRLLSMETGINSNDIRRGSLLRAPNNDQFKKLVDASAELQKLPIFLDDTPALSISAIRTRARRLKRRNNLQFLLVDYLQLIRGTGKRSEENRVQEISEISMGLKAIAKELNIPVMALSQLSRQVESRTDKHPQLSDLRESGSIEQDADIVMFIYREAYYKEREKPSDTNHQAMAAWSEEFQKIKDITEIMVAKNRNGPIGNVNIKFNNNTTKFEDYSAQDSTPIY